MKSGPTTPEEALAWAREAVAEGTIEFGSDTLTAQFDAEIQEIYAAVRMAETGKPPRRPIWTADGQTIGFVVALDDAGRPTAAARDAVRSAGRQLGIELSVDDVWEEAAMRLRATRAVVRS